MESVHTETPTDFRLSIEIFPSIKVRYQVAVTQHDRLARQLWVLRTDPTIEACIDQHRLEREAGAGLHYLLPLEIFDSVISSVARVEVTMRRLRPILDTRPDAIIATVKYMSDDGCTTANNFDRMAEPS